MTNLSARNCRSLSELQLFGNSISYKLSRNDTDLLEPLQRLLRLVQLRLNSLFMVDSPVPRVMLIAGCEDRLCNEDFDHRAAPEQWATDL